MPDIETRLKYRDEARKREMARTTGMASDGKTSLGWRTRLANMFRGRSQPVGYNTNTGNHGGKSRKSKHSAKNKRHRRKSTRRDKRR